MPHPSRSAQWHGRWEERWETHPPSGPGSRSSRLWIPVVVALAIQVPPAAILLRFADTAADRRMFALGLLVAVVGPLALIAARRFPGPVVAVVSAGAAASILITSQTWGPPYIPLAFGIVSAIVRGARIWAWISVAAAWLATLAAAVALELSLHPLPVAGITLGILVVFGLAEGIRTRRERWEQLGRSIAERKQTEVQAERVRIARELHDVLAHSLSQINVQASVGLHLAERQPETAAAALASIKETSKIALDEVRAVLGVLRAEGGADPAAPLVPEPDLSRLPGLVASVSSQGIAVTLDDRLARVPSAAIQLAVYRIVQESLTNVVRHSQARSALVTLAEQSGALSLTISDDGHGARSESVEADAPGGRGLLGMQERAELLGGTLITDSGPDGFTVSAAIPLPEPGPAAPDTTTPPVPSAPAGPDTPGPPRTELPREAMT